MYFCVGHIGFTQQTSNRLPRLDCPSVSAETPKSDLEAYALPGPSECEHRNPETQTLNPENPTHQNPDPKPVNP